MVDLFSVGEPVGAEFPVTEYRVKEERNRIIFEQRITVKLIFANE